MLLQELEHLARGAKQDYWKYKYKEATRIIMIAKIKDRRLVIIIADYFNGNRLWLVFCQPTII